MVENDCVILTSIYLEKLGHLQLDLLKKQTETSQLRMKMKMIQAAVSRDEKPDIKTIDNEINMSLQNYYAKI